MKPWTWNGTYSKNDKGTNTSFKIALIPSIYTSEFIYIGKILNNVLGYVGLGDAVDIYVGEEKETSAYDSIAKLINFGLNLGLKRIGTDIFSLESNVYYSRTNYDAIAKNDIFGLSLTASFWRIKIPIDFGYRNFYYISEYFTSRYPNTWFVDAGIAFSIKKSNLRFSYGYDAIRQHQFKIVFDIKGAFSMLYAGGGSLNKNQQYIGQNQQYISDDEYEDGVSAGGGGLRYRYVKGDISDFLSSAFGW